MFASKKYIKFFKVFGISILLLVLFYNLTIFLLGYQFNMKYFEYSERVNNKIIELRNKKYSTEDYLNSLKVKMFLLENSDLQKFSNKKYSEILNDHEYYYSFLSDYTDFINEYENLMNIPKIINTDIKTIKTPVPAYQVFTYANELMGLKILKLFDEGNISEGTKLFNRLHENRLRHFLHANTLMIKLINLYHLKNDLYLANIIKEKHNINLPLKKLTPSHISIEEAINSEIEMMLNTNTLMTSNTSVTKMGFIGVGHAKLNFMNEVGMQSYFRLIDYYNDFSKKIKPEYIEFNPTFFERTIAPIEVILLRFMIPDYFDYKNEFINYNNSVEKFGVFK